MVWAKASRGIWGLGHVFEGQLYFSPCILNASVVRESCKLPRPEPPTPTPSPPSSTGKPNIETWVKEQKEGEYVQRFQMWRNVRKDFYSEPVAQP